jgi:hypothetical protein
MNASSSYRGRGSPSMFKCSKCDGVHFQQVSPEFGYDDNSFALFEEPMAFAEYKTGVGIEDYFRDFSLTAICSKCHSSELISSIDL